MRYSFDKENHIHQLNIDGAWKPLFGTSTVVGVLNKNGLTWWASGMACSQLGWSNHKIKNKFVPIEDRVKIADPYLEKIKRMDCKQFVSLLDKAYRAHKEKLDSSADAGTDLHLHLENFVKFKMGLIPEPEKVDRIQPFVEWCDKNVEKFLWSEAHCFSSQIWCGGISDVGAVLKSGQTAIIDFKSSKEAYESQFIQIAGYDIQIRENGFFDDCGNRLGTLKESPSAYFIFPFGSEPICAVQRSNVSELMEAFKAAVVLHRIVSKEK